MMMMMIMTMMMKMMMMCSCLQYETPQTFIPGCLKHLINRLREVYQYPSHVLCPEKSHRSFACIHANGKFGAADCDANILLSIKRRGLNILNI